MYDVLSFKEYRFRLEISKLEGRRIKADDEYIISSICLLT